MPDEPIRTAPDAARFDWPEQPFAEEVARAQDGDTILFRVTTPVTRGALQEWDGPFDFKFFERTDGTYELRLRRFDG